MKLAIALDGENVSQHFGHCDQYAIFHIDGSNAIHHENLKSPKHEPGKLPVFLAEHKVNMVIAGGMGPKAVELFNERGIKVILGVSGTVDLVAKQFAEGLLKPGESSCHH